MFSEWIRGSADAMKNEVVEIKTVDGDVYEGVGRGVKNNSLLVSNMEDPIEIPIDKIEKVSVHPDGLAGQVVKEELSPQPFFSKNVSTYLRFLNIDQTEHLDSLFLLLELKFKRILYEYQQKGEIPPSELNELHHQAQYITETFKDGRRPSLLFVQDFFQLLVDTIANQYDL